jgi:hypothetical protein
MPRPVPTAPHPPATVRVVRAAVPKGNRELFVAAALDPLFTDGAVGALFPAHGGAP